MTTKFWQWAALGIILLWTAGCRRAAPVTTLTGTAVPHTRPLPIIATPTIGSGTAVSTATILATDMPPPLATSTSPRTATPVPTNAGGPSILPPEYYETAAAFPTRIPTRTPTPSSDLQAERAKQYPAHYTTIVVEGYRAYLSYGERLYVLDVSNPNQPKQLGQITLLNRINQTLIADGYIYAALGTPGNRDGDKLYTGLQVVYLSNLSAPRAIGFYSTNFAVTSVAIVSGLAYLGGSVHDGWHVVDVMVPDTPTEVGRVKMPYGSNIKTIDARVYRLGNSCFRTCRGYLSIFDVSQPLSPIEGKRYEQSGVLLDIVARDDYAYVSGRELIILDLSRPGRIVRTGGVFLQDTGLKLALTDHYVYVATPNGLEVVDIIDPLVPITVGLWGEKSHLNDITIVGNYAYVLDWDAGLRVLNISDPANPVEVGRFAVDGS